MQGALECSDCMRARVNELKAEQGDVCVSNRKPIKANFLSREGKISGKINFHLVAHSQGLCFVSNLDMWLTVNPDGNCSASTVLKITTPGKERNVQVARRNEKNGKLSLDGRGLAHHTEDEHLIEQLIISDKQQNYAFPSTDSLN